MKKQTFTIFTANNDRVYGYLFNTTRAEAQEIVSEMNEKAEKTYYYMDGYFD